MRAGPASATRLIITSIALDSPPRPIIDILTDVVLQEQWEDNISFARERAETWSLDVLTRLNQERNALLELGQPPRYTFNSSSEYMIQGACFVEPKDSYDVQEMKSRRLRADDYYAVLHDITFDQFETLCGKIIELLGVENPVVTRRSADEGIDFYGKLSLESIFFPKDLSPTIQKQLTIWLIGQAKQYFATRPGTQEIRELVGSVYLGRSSAFGSADSPFPDLIIKPSDPVFTILITTGSFSSNAVRLLKRSGVIGVDGEMLAAFLADRGVGLEGDTLSPDAFVNWLEEINE